MEIDSVVIKSSGDFAEFRMSERNGLLRSAGSEFYRVTLEATDIKISVKVYAFDPFDKSFWSYFEDLANNWRGWESEKQWSSLEGEFKVSSESDSLGHIRMGFALESFDKWNAQIIINLDAGQLEDIAQKVKQFFFIEKTAS